MGSPFDELDLREERRKGLVDFERRQDERRHKREQENTVAAGPKPPADDLFNLPDKRDQFDLLFGNVEDSRPLADQEDAGGTPFGAVALSNVLGDVREGNTGGIDNIFLRAVATPFVKAGQGALAALEWSGNVGQTAAKHVTYNAQRYISGRQELENLVQDKMRAGASYSRALNEAWEETNLELLTIPFFTTALTPQGSITLDAQDLIAAGFDPIELALTFGTGGLGSGAGLIAAATGKGVKTGLKTAVGQSIGFRGARALGRGAKGAKKFAGSPREGVAAYRAGREMSRQQRLVERTVAKIPDADTLVAQAFPRGDATVAEKFATSQYAGRIAKRIIGMVNPNAIARAEGGGNAANRAWGAMSRVAGIGGNAVELSVAWAEGALKDTRGRFRRSLNLAPGGGAGSKRVFGIDDRGVVTAAKVKYTEFGKSAVRKRGLDPNKTEIAMGDLLEFYRFGSAPGKAHRFSYFEGLDEQMEELVRRRILVEKEMGNMLVEEGLAGNIKEALKLIGTSADAHRMIHRVVHTGTAIGENGEQILIDLRGGMKTASADVTKTRHYEMAIEGIQAGNKYVDPAESLEDWLGTGYRMIGEKRMKEVLDADGVIITTKEVMKRFHPGVVQAVASADSLVRRTAANVRRIARKKNRRGGTKTGMKTGVQALEPTLAKMARKRLSLETESINLSRKIEQHIKVAKSAKNDGTRRASKNAAQKKMGRIQHISADMAAIDQQIKEATERQAKGLGKIEGLDSEMLGLTDDMTQALHEEVLAAAAQARANAAYTQTREGILGALKLDSQLFGGKPGTDTLVEVFHDGPLANNIVIKDVATTWKQLFGKKGNNAVKKIETFTGTLRTLSTGIDIGWLTIQGNLIAAMHPRAYARAALKSLEAVANPNARLKYINDNMMDIIEAIESGVDIGSSEFFMALERGGGLTRVADHLQRRFVEREGMSKAITAWRTHAQPFGRFGAGFHTFLDVGKIELWKGFKPMRAGTDSAADAALRAQLASHVNNVMGTLNTKFLGVSPTQRQVESALIFFSPRYTRSAFALVGELMRGPGRPGSLDGLASREAMRAIGGMVAAGTLAMWAFGEATGNKPGLNPLEPGWMTMEFAGQNVGIGGSTRALLDTMFKSVAAVAGVDDRDGSDLMDFNIFDPQQRRTNPLIRFWLNRTAPGVREVLTMQTFSGESLDSPFEFLGKGIAPKLTPFAVQNFINPGPGEDPGLILLPIESTGLRSRPLSARDKRTKERDRIAQALYQRPWDSTKNQRGLDLDEKRAIEANNPDLQRLTEQVNASSDPEMARYFDALDADRLWKEEQITVAAKEFIESQEMNGRTFREKYDDVVRQVFNNRQRREDPEGEFKIALGWLSDSRERRDDLMTQFDRLVEEYTVEVKENPLSKDAFGNPDFRQMKLNEEAFRKRVGDEMYQRIQNHYRKIDENGEPLELAYPEERYVVQLRRDRDLLAEVGYWSMADTMIGDDDALWEAWKRLDASDSPLIQKEIKRMFPALKRIERQVARRRKQIRRTNAAVDAALIRWYGFRAGNVENRQMERALGQQERQRAAS